ncbi:MAG: hypothetical protein KME43_25985 [Myxacorys chilensis ATA2-1-KO14]|nr:hypothetical protein [Myxacorys chilensis ATA2-1-KO14]
MNCLFHSKAEAPNLTDNQTAQALYQVQPTLHKAKQSFGVCKRSLLQQIQNAEN